MPTPFPPIYPAATSQPAADGGQKKNQRQHKKRKTSGGHVGTLEYTRCRIDLLHFSRAGYPTHWRTTRATTLLAAKK